jgi:glycosyltransferase involved in cell wall biosynthesis
MLEMTLAKRGNSAASRQQMKPKVLVLADTYLPGYLAGGPVKSLSRLVEELGEEMQWAVLTRDRDLGATQPYPSVTPDCWVKVGKADVCYLSPSALRLDKWFRMIRGTPHDVLYLNSYLSPAFSILPLIGRKLGWLPSKSVVLAPRGEFSPGALALKARKKSAAIMLGRALGVHSGLTWHASTAEEAADIKRVCPANPTSVWVARNLTGDVGSVLQVEPTHNPPSSKALRVVFAARIAKKKNLDFALRVISQTTLPLHFTIIGPVQDAAHFAECQRQIDRLPENVTVDVKGAMPPQELQYELRTHDVFFLPSRGENFGHAFVEAWHAGLPVLTSDQTPWKDLRNRDLGWDLPLGSEDSFGEALVEAFSRSPARVASQRRTCGEFGAQVALDATAVEANRRLFRAAAGLL